MHLDNMVGVMILYVVFYMPMNVMLYTGYLRTSPLRSRGGARGRRLNLDDVLEGDLPIMKPMHATVAILTGLAVWNDVMTPLVIMGGSGVYTLRLRR